MWAAPLGALMGQSFRHDSRVTRGVRAHNMEERDRAGEWRREQPALCWLIKTQRSIKETEDNSVGMRRQARLGRAISRGRCLEPSSTASQRAALEGGVSRFHTSMCCNLTRRPHNAT